ncbi:hypothetical protein GQ53DRAFT_745904 [Thozetella sp. PMI_491]|nr:hypothetical protein GQ53DRAFT_745904 [Thozetella sp. PMI_491]
MERSSYTAGQNRGRRRARSPSPPSGESERGMSAKKRQAKTLSEFDRNFIAYYNQQLAEEKAKKDQGGKLGKEERAKIIADFNAESEAELTRRNTPSLQERLEEDGKELRQKIETDAQIVIVLEESVTRRAKCRADDDCLRSRVNNYYGSTAIADRYRICVQGVENRERFGRTKHYYHVVCFQHMVDLNALIPSKLKLGGLPSSWPLMVQK